MSRQYFTKDSAQPFADAVLIDGRTLYLSGRIGLVPGTRNVPSSAEEEARRLLDDLKQVLSAAGMSMANLVQLQVFCSDVSLWQTFNEIYKEYFDGPLPPRAFVGSGTLLFGARFEMIGVAIKDAG